MIAIFFSRPLTLTINCFAIFQLLSPQTFALADPASDLLDLTKVADILLSQEPAAGSGNRFIKIVGAQSSAAFKPEARRALCTKSATRVFVSPLIEPIKFMRG